LLDVVQEDIIWNAEKDGVYSVQSGIESCWMTRPLGDGWELQTNGETFGKLKLHQNQNIWCGEFVKIAYLHRCA
jgi:hypothetical protein